MVSDITAAEFNIVIHINNPELNFGVNLNMTAADLKAYIQTFYVIKIYRYLIKKNAPFFKFRFNWLSLEQC